MLDVTTPIRRGVLHTPWSISDLSFSTKAYAIRPYGLRISFHKVAGND